jgi:hypothetical protein
LTLDHGPTRTGPIIVNFDALACRIDAYLGANPEPELSRRVFYVLANAFAQLFGSGPLPLEAKFWNLSIALPSKMRNAIALFKRELTRRNGRSTMLEFSGFVGMMERDPESIYDLLLVTPENTDSEFDSEGSYHPLRECNSLHLSEDGVALVEDAEDDTYLIPCTPGE